MRDFRGQIGAGLQWSRVLPSRILCRVLLVATLDRSPVYPHVSTIDVWDVQKEITLFAVVTSTFWTCEPREVVQIHVRQPFSTTCPKG